MSYENLMRPIRIQNMTLRNRVMMAPMGTNLANPDGSISEEHKNYYQLRAKGGTGLIVVENACVAFPLGSNGTTQLRLDHDSFIPHMYELTEKVHAWGCKISIQECGVHHLYLSRYLRCDPGVSDAERELVLQKARLLQEGPYCCMDVE